MGTEDIRERDLAGLRDVVASLHEPSPGVPTPSANPIAVANADQLTHDPPGPGVPWHSLMPWRELLRADIVCLNGWDSSRQETFFVQQVGPEGPADLFVQEVGPDGPVDPMLELPDVWVEVERRFWENYWAWPLSYPERTGDWDGTLSIDAVLREIAIEPCAPRQKPHAQLVTAAVATGPSRPLHVWAVRARGTGFTDRERGYLELIKPHFVEVWRRSCVSSTPLTAGQRRVLELVRHGHTNRQVARDLGISEATVRTHPQNAYAALGVDNRVAAVAATFGAGAPAPTQRRSRRDR